MDNSTYDNYISKFVMPLFAEIKGQLDIYDFFNILVKNDDVTWTYKSDKLIKMYYKNIRFNLVYTKFGKDKSIMEFIILEHTDIYIELCSIFEYMCEHKDVKDKIINYTKITNSGPLFKV